jgi:hypothetical protein
LGQLDWVLETEALQFLQVEIVEGIVALGLPGKSKTISENVRSVLRFLKSVFKRVSADR